MWVTKEYKVRHFLVLQTFFVFCLVVMPDPIFSVRFHSWCFFKVMS